MRSQASQTLGAALVTARPVVLDVPEVRFIDSLGIGYLIRSNGPPRPRRARC